MVMRDFRNKDIWKRRSLRRLVMYFAILLLSLLLALPISAAGISRKSVILEVKGSCTLKVDGAKGTVKWSSSNKKVASVSGNGNVTAKKKGKARITAKVGKTKYTCEVTVRQPVTSIKLNKENVTLKKKGATVTLKATVGPKNANNKKVSWFSSNNAVASVNSHGVVKAKSSGTCVITAIANDGFGNVASCTVYVNTKKSYTYKLSIITSASGGKLYSDVLFGVYVKTDDPDGKTLDLTTAVPSVRSEYISVYPGVEFADINGSYIDTDERIMKVNGGYFQVVGFEYPGKHTIVLKKEGRIIAKKSVHIEDSSAAYKAWRAQVIKKLINSDMTEKEKMDTVSDYIVKNFKYSATDTDATTLIDLFSEASSPFFDCKVMDCQGAASMMCWFASDLGLEAQVEWVTRYSYFEGHQIASIKIDGEYVDYDATPPIKMRTITPIVFA